MLRRHFITNNKIVINGGLPVDIPNNTIYYWTTETVDKIKFLDEFTCYDVNGLELEFISNVIENNIGIITMSGDIYRCQAVFLGGLDNFLDIRYIQLPKSCAEGWAVAAFINLQELYIHDTMTCIDRRLLPYVTGAYNLKIIKVDSNNTVYDSRNNCNAVIETATNMLIIGCQTTIIPNGVTAIGEGAFAYCLLIPSIVIPNSVTSIGNSAFSNCSSLTSVTIPNSVTSIGDWAFDNCKSLTSVVLPDSIMAIGSNAFADCTSLTTINIPNNMTEIANSTFLNCRSLTSVSIPNSVTSIGDWAFDGCSPLTSINIPNSVETIGAGAFRNCSLNSIIIPNSVTIIADNAFAYCPLTSITFNGTILEWNNIIKGSDWANTIPATVVHCTDGDVAI